MELAPSLARHVDAVVARTRAFYQAAGPNMDNLEAIFAATGDCALLLTGTPQEILPRLDLRATRKVYLRAYCTGREEAEHLVAKVRERAA